MLVEADRLHIPQTTTQTARVEVFAERLVNQLGIQPALNGRDYLAYGIVLCIHTPLLRCLLTKELYPRLARHFGTSAQCVERSIRHAIAQAWTDGGIMHWRHIFASFRAFTPGIKPTTGKLIAMAVLLYHAENPET